MKNWIIAIISIIMMIATIAGAIATTTIYMEQPSQNGEIIAEYPQTIRFYASSNETIQYCNVTTNGIVYNIPIKYTTIEVVKTITQTEGTYTANITCMDTVMTSAQLTYVINDMASFREQRQREFMLGILAILYGGLLWVWIKIKKSEDDLWRLLISLALILIAIYATTVEDSIIMYLPITVSVILFISAILAIINRG